MLRVKDHFNCCTEQNASGSLCNCSSFSWNANEEKYTNFVSNRIVKADVKAVQTHADCAVNSKLKSVECFLINSGISDPLLILSGGKNTLGGNSVRRAVSSVAKQLPFSCSIAQTTGLRIYFSLLTSQFEFKG